MKRQLFWFGVVGVSAMLVHLATVALVLVPLGVPPLLANCAGFLVAFQVSHAGHRRFTFQDGSESASLSRRAALRQARSMRRCNTKLPSAVDSIGCVLRHWFRRARCPFPVNY